MDHGRHRDDDALVPGEYDPACPMVPDYHPTPIAKTKTAASVEDVAVEEDAAVPEADAAPMGVVEETLEAITAAPTAAVVVNASATQTAMPQSGSAATQTAIISLSADTQTEAADFDLRSMALCQGARRRRAGCAR